MIVDIDIGNTRAKWRLTDGGLVIKEGFIETKFGDWSPLVALRSHNPGRVRASNVAGEEVGQQLRGAITKAFGIEVDFAVSCASVGQVVSGYRNPKQLGIDRWLAILAGWDLFRDDCVVVDAGSALTIDFVNATARHIGGYIIPGQKMMLSALYGETSGVHVNPSEEMSVDFGASTTEAVQNGCLAMALALIEKTMVDKNKRCGLIKMVLTGGDAESLLERLPDTVMHRPNLVLDGLALALP